MMIRWIVAAAMATSAWAAQAGNTPMLPAVGTSAYQLGPGDELRIHVSGLDALNNTYFVDDTGRIAVPMLPPVTVSGKTVREAEAAIADQIRSRQLVLNPEVSAQVQAYRPFFIAGEVQRPGQYPYVPGMSLMTAVSIAGGYTFRANTKTATITRANVKGRASQETQIQPGDVIVIRESWF
ncbi:polysaccharide biosynthesis/export family protein [Flavisphingomonas formosensis]|uniref:polysaccharide biosynthesis/export family protein n=1 Tax=Flavisphingomonas formosensis TaxID=861534 RepID=UPI0012F80C1C|nr:polysaccharide biosynthesis/export family protein [Sphingomonas formosensis]